MKKLLLVDFYALFHRSRNALMRSTGGLSTSYGVPTTGIYGFTNNLLSAIDSEKPTHVVVCYDAGGNWRKEASAEYKANRGGGDSANWDDFRYEAREVLDTVLPALGLETVGIKGYEADDSIYTLSRDAIDFDEVVIFTCDQDILQCVTDRVRVLLFNSAKKVTSMGLAEVIEKWGVVPSQIPLVKALAGDGSDNVAGIKGVGGKTAAKIVNDNHGNLEAILKHKKVKGFEDVVQKNLPLVTSTYVAELESTDFGSFELGQGSLLETQQIFALFEFNALLKRITKISSTLGLKADRINTRPYATA